MESATGEKSADITKRITRTVVTHTNYGSAVSTTGAGVSDEASHIGFGSGAAGAAISSFGNTASIYDSSVTSETLMSSTSAVASGFASGRLDRVQGELSSFKKRIDANTEEQREHADLMAGLQQKVEDYRRRIAEIESQIANQKADEVVSFNIGETIDTWTPPFQVVAGADLEVSRRLEEERRRNEDLRLQIAQLQAENQRIRQQFDITLQDKERSYQIRERAVEQWGLKTVERVEQLTYKNIDENEKMIWNLAQYLSEEQKKMMDLWTELQQVRRQCADYKEQTVRDLENQRNELAKVMRNIGGVARQLNITSTYDESGAIVGQDTTLMEALQRFREQQALPAGASMEDYDALMKKYEEAIERIVHMESGGDVSSGKIAALEAELRRTRERLAESQEVLRKLHDLTKESDKDLNKRARSLSPAGQYAVPSQVLRSVRYAVRSRDNEIMQLQRKLKNADMQINELVARFENAEEARRRLEKQLADAKRDISVQVKAVEDANREVRRLEERLHGVDSEKNVAENARKHLEEEMRRMKLMFDQTAADGERKALEDAEAQMRLVEEEYKNRITELTRRIDALLEDNKHLKGDLTVVRDKFRNLEIDYNSTLRKLDEKDQALRHLDDLKSDLLKDLENQRARFDAVTSELDSLQANFSATTKNTVAIEMTVKEIKQQRDDITKQKDDLGRQLADVLNRMDLEIKKREDIEKASLRHISEVEKLKSVITDYESQLMMLRRHNDDLDTQLKTSQAKITTLENSIASAQKEIAKLTELNGKLQKEKNDIMSLKQKADVELDAVRDRLRKVEQEVEKLKAENKAVNESEEKAKILLKEESKKVYLLERELQEAKAEIDQLRRRLSQLDQENKERLEYALRTTKGPSDRSDVYETTEITEVRIKELGDKYKLDLEKLENDRDELLRRVQLLQDELTEKQHTIDRQHREIDDLRNQYETEIERLNTDISNLETKHRNELDDERDQHNRVNRSDVYETTEITEVRIKELGDKYKLDLEKLENDRDELLRRVQLLQDELTEKQHTIDRQHREIDDLRNQYETEIERLNTDISNLETKHRNELDDERDQHNREVEALKASEDDLRAKVAVLEKKLHDALERQKTLEKELVDWEEKYDVINKELQKVRDELEIVRLDAEKEVEALKASEDDLRAKVAVLEKKLHDALERQKTLEKELVDWEEKYDVINKELQKVRDELEIVRLDAEKEIEKWKSETYKAQAELKGLEVANETLRSQLASGNDRIASLNKTINEQAAKIRELNSYVRRLEEELADSKAAAATFEADLEKTAIRLRTVEEQYAELQLDNNKLRSEIDLLNRQIDVLKNTNASNVSEIERLKKKVMQLTDTSKQQSEELEKLRNERDQLEKAYREKTKQVEQLTEMVKTLETKLARARRELQDLSDKLTATETERNALRSEVKKLQQELQFGKDQMHRKTDEFHAALDDLANAHRSSEDGRVNALQDLEMRKFEISDLQSRLDNSEQRLAALQQEYINADKERELLNDSLRRFQSVISRTVMLDGDRVDIHSIDVHVQKLLSRVDKLERERNEYRDSLDRLKQKTGESHAVNTHETLFKSVEERITDAQDEKRAAEAKLASAKQLLRSQEEALKLRDDERRQMKSKIVAFELETRGKEAQIRHLNELLKTLRSDLNNAQNEIRGLREHEGQWDTSKIQLESKIRDHDGEEHRVKMLISNFETEKQSLHDSLKKLTLELQASEGKNADLKDDADRLKKDLAKAERVEVDLRRTLEEQTRLAREGQHLREQLIMAQNDLTNANNRKQQLESELLNVRSELRDQKQHLHDANNRISDLQRQLQDANNDRNRLNDRINGLERTISTLRNTENDLRHQLSAASGDRRALQGELDDLRRRMGQFEIERKTAHAKIEELTQIRITLIKKIEILETEKRSAETIISETASQREEIERSLNALERENKELTRSCAQLQQQIAQLELDNGNRLIQLTNKQKEEHDRFVQSVKAEKAQVERVIQNRDRAHKNHIMQLESQLAMLREQLNSERLRRRDFSDRVYVSDVTKVGGSVYAGLGTISGVSYPQTGSFDYAVGNQSAFSSIHASQPPAVYSPAGSDVYRTSATTVSLREPADTTQETYTTTYRTSSLSQSAGLISALGERYEPSAFDLGDSEVSKKTTVTTVRTTRTGYTD
ncbi:Spindle- and centromere-associated protein [Toxocara canis]|uniref:Spindle-and centromere-associated protein n=1 Tax=Toxocara canis TaxID=6265 RepID=A0A0B2UVI1_TOXCA|nr:Spindle- and centromere-associated protein [Toxocara canis]